jgi:hypothetical protein
MTTPTKSDEQDPIETVSSSLAEHAPGTGDEVVAANVEPPPDGADARLSALPPEIDESGLNITPGALRQMVALEEERREIIREFIARNLKSGTDFGTINSNGRESKPSLFKPGAEKICLLFQLRPKFGADRATLEMAGNPQGLFAYICRLVDHHNHVVGEGRGAAELGEREGWTVNNAIKIAEKRAHVDAVLRVVGLSEIFTQDLEDMEQRHAFEHEAASRRQPLSGNGTTAGEPARSLYEGGARSRNSYVAEASVERPAEPVVRPTSAPERPEPAERPSTSAGADDDLCTEQQQRAIRALLPRAGISEDELVSKLGIESVAGLTRTKAARVIDRLTVNARERSQKTPA